MPKFHSGGTLCANPPSMLRAVLTAAVLMIPVSANAQESIYFTDIFRPSFSNGRIQHINSDASGAHTLANVGGGLRGVAVDSFAGKIYWTDVDNDIIRRANLDGSGAEDLVTSGLAFPISIDLDALSGRLYWVDQTLAQIYSAHLDGSDVRLVADVFAPTGIIVDAANNKLYWTEAVPNTLGKDGVILRANLDGSQIETVVMDANRPARIALDLKGGKIYWTDYVVDVVRRANLDGSNVETLYAVGDNLNPGGISLDLRNGKVYWGQDTSSSPHEGKIMRMNLDGSNPEDVTDDDYGLIGALVIPATLLGDLDNDGDVDWDDDLITDCLSGPDHPISPGCEPSDLQADQDVDIADYRVFQAAFTG